MPSGPLIMFGKTVRELRKKRKLTQEELAEKAHLHRNYVSDVERGTRNISLLNILELARALGVKPDRLMRW
jgi:transcriptional regulator with XRE-family HTH domain